MPPSKVNDAPLLQTLGIKLIACDAGRCELQLSVDERHLRSFNILHGGVTATLLDTALGFAVMSTANPDQHAVTSQLNINFVRAAFLGDELIATAEIQHRGSKTAVARGEVRRADNQLVALATGTFHFLPLPPTA